MEPNKSDQPIHKRQRDYKIEHVLDAIQQSDDSELEDLALSDEEDGWADDMEPISSSENEESDEHMAEEDQSKSSDDEPMRINVQDKPDAYDFEKRREFIPPANTEFVPPNMKPIVADRSPHEYFSMFVTNDMLEMIVTETMNYSMMKHGVAIKLNKDDIEQFISVYYNMGLVKMPDVRCYWDTCSRYPPVADVMSRARFQQIQTCLHFANNELVTDDQKKDRVWKLRPWIENVRTNIQSVSGSEQQSVVEIMVAFKGRSILKQYIPAKPKKWGFKLWGRCSSTGFLHDFDVYQGRGTGIDGDNMEACGLGGSVVLQLCQSISSGHNYKIFADNYFSNFRMVEELMTSLCRYNQRKPTTWRTTSI